jgi:UDP-N-acetylglucosamine diphosphorylase/glucosamine-1-phosphate N-acetyltransferase
MSGPLVVFEDDAVADLYPLTLTRPVFDLVCGSRALGEKLVSGLGAMRPGGSGSARFHMRSYLGSEGRPMVTSYADLFREADLLALVNGRLISCESLAAKLDFTRPVKYVSNGAVVAACVPKSLTAGLEKRLGLPLDRAVFADLPSSEVDACVVRYPWDLVSMNARELQADFARLGGGRIDIEPQPGVFLVNESAIRIARGVGLAPGVVIDAAAGPVTIESGAVIMANASLQGPLHVGAASVIKMGAAIYGGTTIGPACKVGGEVGETIFQGYSNKQHGGFVGHSYIGEWVNLGAGTNTSDLKNNYSTVKVPIGGVPVDSGEIFAGIYIGDHSKSGIGTVFNTGTTVGVCCNVYGADYPPKHLPSFTWGGSSKLIEHRLAAALETARRAMKRRGRVFDSRDETILKQVFELTKSERASFLIRR